MTCPKLPASVSIARRLINAMRRSSAAG
jgi:hypothetical protein